jgi:hypothetical protein
VYFAKIRPERNGFDLQKEIFFLKNAQIHQIFEEKKFQITRFL